MKIICLKIAIASALLACGDQVPKAPKTQDQKPHTSPPDFHFSDDMPDTIEFEQGYGIQLNVLSTARVPGPEAAVVGVENLPDGAQFDGRIFSWIPPCGRGIVFQRGLAEFKIRFTLWSGDNKEEFVQRRVNLRVYQFREGPGRVCGDPALRENGSAPNLTDRNIYFDQNFHESMPFFQGKKQTYEISNVVHALPSGTVRLTVTGLPDGATFDGNAISWQPSCADNSSFINGKRVVAVQIHAVKVGDETLTMTRSAELIVHKQTPCTDDL